MKKIISLILTVAILMSFMTIGVVYAKEEIVFEESFENGIERWESFIEANPDGYKLVDNMPKDGKYSAYINDNSETSNAGIKLKNIEVQPGCSYKLSADMKVISGTLKIYLRFFDENNKKVESKSNGAKVGDWKNLSVTLDAGSTVKYADVVVSGNLETLGEGYVDNIKLVKASENSASSQKPEETQITVKEGLYSESFENGLEGWQVKAAGEGPAPKAVTAKATDGKYSVYIEDKDDQSGSASIFSPLISVTPSKNYTAKADFIDVEGVVKLYIQYFNQEGKQISSVSANAKVGASTLTHSVVAPPDAAGAKVVIATNAATVGKGYVDNISFSETALSEGDVANAVIAEINTKLAAAKPGDVIEIPDGTYKSARINFTNNGTEDKPITLKAKNPGKAVFTGESTVRVTGSYLVTEGLLFTGVTTKFIFVFESGTHHSQIKECAFIDNDPVDEKGNVDPNAQQKWVYLKGQYNKMTNCYMRGKTALGMMAEVIRQTADADYHVIENCYFGDFKLGGANGLETLRLGTSQQSLSDSHSTVSGCFFEACNGEVETISVKSGGNYILNNTLYNNKGAIVLRHGNGTLVEGNLIVGGEPTARPTGVRVIGENHIVKNNYMINLPKDSAAIYVSDGNPNPLIDEYLEVKNLVVENNTIIGADSNIVAGEYAPSANNASNRILPPEGKISNNVILSYKGKNPLIYNGDVNHKLTFEGNIAFGKELDYTGDVPAGIEYINPEYTINDKFISFKNGKGADTSVVAKAPKSPFDVMPKWVKEAYYDTGKIKFEPVAGDPFNTDFDTSKYMTVPGKVNVMLNGIRKDFDVDAEIINGRTMVPMRAIFEDFGAEVLWDDATKTATASTTFTTVKITNDSSVAYVNGKETTLDSPATIINGRFLVPLRFVSEAFGAQVGWNSESRAAIINYNKVIVSGTTGEYTNTHDIENALTVYGITVGGFNEEGNEVVNAFDGDFNSKWTSKADDNGIEAYGIFDLSSSKTLESIHIAFGTGNKRNYKFTISVSDDNINFTTVLEGVSCGTTLELEKFDLKGAKGRFLKITGHGNQDNAWNNFNEIVVVGK